MAKNIPNVPDAAPKSEPKKLDPAIRAAVTRNRGGWDKASDADILRLWNSLPAALQAEYLKPKDAAPQEKTDDAARSESKPNA